MHLHLVILGTTEELRRMTIWLTAGFLHLRRQSRTAGAAKNSDFVFI